MIAVIFYKGRLERLRPFYLLKKRLSGDLIEIHKIMKVWEAVTLVDGLRTGGNDIKQRRRENPTCGWNFDCTPCWCGRDEFQCVLEERIG